MTKTEEPDVDPWVLVCTDHTNQTPAFLGAGVDGFRIARDGTTLSGESPLAAFSTGTDRGFEVLDSPQPISWTVDGVRLNPVSGTEYRQSLDMRTGHLTTSWRQTIGSADVSIKSVVSIEHRLIADWEFTSDSLAKLELKGAGVFPNSRYELKPGELLAVTLPDAIRYGSLTMAPPQWDSRIVIDGPEVDQRAVNSFTFYLNTASGGTRPGGPFGVSNETYEGHVFWDSDVWVLPAIALFEPEWAQWIVRTRADQADRSSIAYRYPWESDHNGDDVTDGSTTKAEHQSGDVMWALDFGSSLLFLHPPIADRVGTAVANHYVSRLALNEHGQSEIRDVTGVDEWFEGDNCLYTNAIADWTIKRYLGEDVNMYYPRDEKGLLAYDGDERMAYKQAAAPLILWPLEREDLVEDPIAFLDLFEGKEAPNGPAMSHSVYALIRARYGDADHAYETWRESWKKYTDGNPLMLFSEKPGRPDLTYFLTGAAGCLNAVIYGFIGVRIVDEEPPDEAKLKLMNDKWLVVRPNLPKAWKSVTFKGMQVLGNRYDVHCVGRTATITPTD